MGAVSLLPLAACSAATFASAHTPIDNYLDLLRFSCLKTRTIGMGIRRLMVVAEAVDGSTTSKNFGNGGFGKNVDAYLKLNSILTSIWVEMS